jgi:hypothetical protein
VLLEVELLLEPELVLEVELLSASAEDAPPW